MRCCCLDSCCLQRRHCRCRCSLVHLVVCSFVCSFFRSIEKHFCQSGQMCVSAMNSHFERKWHRTKGKISKKNRRKKCLTMETTQYQWSPYLGVSFDPCVMQTYRMCYTTLLAQKVYTSILPFRHRRLHTWKHPNEYKHTLFTFRQQSFSVKMFLLGVISKKCFFLRKSVPSRSKEKKKLSEGKSLNLTIEERQRGGAKQK